MSESELRDAVVPDALPDELDEPKRRRILRLGFLPTMFTLANLVCGFLAVAYMADAHAILPEDAGGAEATKKVMLAGWVILLGMAFDALDGRVARMTRTTSEFGGALDSLADLVTFGVAPALVAKVLIQDAYGLVHERMAFMTACFYVVCAALRLARYNAEQEDTDHAVPTFVGLPSPGAAGVIAGVAICHEGVLRWWGEMSELGHTVGANVLGFGVVTGLALLMVSRVPFTHFGNRFLGGKRPVGRVALALFILMVALHFAGLKVVLAVTFSLYALSGPLMYLPRLVIRRRKVEVSDLFD